MVDVLELAQSVLYGAGAAAVTAGIGYVKAHFGPDAEPFDLDKLGSTLAIGAVLGGAAAFYGIPVVTLETLPAYVVLFPAVVLLVDAGVKAVVRFVRSKLGK